MKKTFTGILAFCFFSLSIASAASAPNPPPPAASPNPPTVKANTANPKTAAQPSAVSPAAPPAAAKKTEVQGQWGTVKTDNALVYEQPDFDAPTLMYLPAGQKVRISKLSYGSYFKFYRVKVSQNKIGYITTIDIVPEKAVVTEKVAKGKQKKKKKVAGAKPTTGKYPPVKPFMQTKYMGLYLGNLNYQETIPGINATETLFVYGFKLTGPHTFISFPTDFTLTLHYGAPSYYNQFSTVKASGFVMIVDWLILFPFLDKKNSSAYIGLGPLLDYSNFQFGTASAGIVTSAELSIGLSAEIGYGIKLGTNWAARAEYKFMWERANYTSYGLSVQNRF